MNEYYTLGGQQEEETDETYAKKIIVPLTEEVRYFAKFINNNLLDPRTNEYRLAKKDKVVWKKVSSRTFMFYTKFLRTKSDTNFLYALRSS